MKGEVFGIFPTPVLKFKMDRDFTKQEIDKIYCIADCHLINTTHAIKYSRNCHNCGNETSLIQQELDRSILHSGYKDFPTFYTLLLFQQSYKSFQSFCCIFRIFNKLVEFFFRSSFSRTFSSSSSSWSRPRPRLKLLATIAIKTETKTKEFYE